MSLREPPIASDEAVRNRSLSAATVAAFTAIIAWFLFFAHGGLQAALSGDDLMNLYGYLQKPLLTHLFDTLRFWSTAYRPLGAFFYVPLYYCFGINPLPFRIACFLILAVNLGLLFVFCRRLSGSRETALLATFLASYHAWFVDLYYSAGTIYDLLCYSFCLGTLLIYIGVRQRGHRPAPRYLIGVAVLYVLALDAKEMAVTLPFFLLLYELLYHSKRDFRAFIITGALTVIYVIGKLRGPDSLRLNPAYSLTISPGRFLDTFHLYLNPLFYRDHWFKDSNTVQMLLAMLLLAAFLRSRVLLFAWFWLLLTILPVAFIAHYSAFFEYLPAAGWALYIAALLTTLRRALAGLFVRALPGLTLLPHASQAVLFLGLAVFLAPLHIRKSLRHFMSAQPPSREIAESLARIRPVLRRGGRILFVNDPFPADNYFLFFEARLFYADMTLTVDRTKTQTASSPDLSGYDAVFGFSGNQLVLAP